MPLTDIAELAPIQRLLSIAQGDTARPHPINGVLPAGWNAQACGGLDLADLRAEQRKPWRAPARAKAAEGVDDAIARNRAATVAAARREHPTAFELATQVEARLARRRAALAQSDGHG